MLDPTGNVRITFRKRKESEKENEGGRMLEPTGSVRITFIEKEKKVRK